MSDFVVHFTKHAAGTSAHASSGDALQSWLVEQRAGDRSGYQQWIEILGEGREVAFLFLPEDDHTRARQFFLDAQVAHTGPHYLGPYIDPRWDIAQIQHALDNVPDAPAPSPDVTPWWL